MNELQVFNNPEFGDIAAIEINGEAWFVGSRIARALGYQDPQGAVKRHVDNEDCSIQTVLSQGGMQQTKLINESGMYTLVIMSDKPEAKKFKRWITKEVIPSIVKTGGYIAQPKTGTPGNIYDAIRLMLDKTEEHEKKLADNEERLRRLEAEDPIMVEPDPQYYLEAMNNHLSKNIYTMTEIATAFGMSARVMNRFLYTQEIIRPHENGWIINKHKGKESYVFIKMAKHKKKDGTIKTVAYTFWTHEGMTFLCTYLKSLGFTMTCSIKAYDRHASRRKRTNKYIKMQAAQ